MKNQLYNIVSCTCSSFYYIDNDYFIPGAHSQATWRERWERGVGGAAVRWANTASRISSTQMADEANEDSGRLRRERRQEELKLLRRFIDGKYV